MVYVYRMMYILELVSGVKGCDVWKYFHSHDKMK